MFSPTLKGLGKRFALLGALMALMLGVGASSAFAEITLVGPGPYSGTDVIEEVQVTEAPTDAMFAAVAECNVTGNESEWGTECFQDSGSPPAVLAMHAHTFEDVEVTREFDNFDFTIQEPGAGETTCNDVEEEDEQCAIVVSYYKPKMGGGLEQFAQEKKDIFFE